MVVNLWSLRSLMSTISFFLFANWMPYKATEHGFSFLMFIFYIIFQFNVIYVVLGLFSSDIDWQWLAGKNVSGMTCVMLNVTWNLRSVSLSMYLCCSVWCSTVLMAWTTRRWVSSSRVWHSLVPGLALMSSTALSWKYCPSLHSRSSASRSRSTRASRGSSSMALNWCWTQLAPSSSPWTQGTPADRNYQTTSRSALRLSNC